MASLGSAPSTSLHAGIEISFLKALVHTGFLSHPEKVDG